MGLFGKKRIKATSDENKKPKYVQIKPLSYPPKIILAWNECLKGNTDITNWLLQNGFQELVITTSIIHQEESGETWLMQNGYPHLLAFAHAIEDDEEALRWLEVNKMDKLYRMALACMYNNAAWDWVKGNCSEDLVLLCSTIRLLLKQTRR